MQANLAGYLLRLKRESGVKKRVIPGIRDPESKGYGRYFGCRIKSRTGVTHHNN